MTILLAIMTVAMTDSSNCECCIKRS